MGPSIKDNTVLVDHDMLCVRDEDHAKSIFDICVNSSLSNSVQHSLEAGNALLVVV